MMAAETKQCFVIHRHGARYPLKRPDHNVLWPTEKSFWVSHVGRLTPVGTIQMHQLGSFLRNRYPWVDVQSVNILSTHRSRALESAWSLALGLLPDTPLKFNCLRLDDCNSKEKVDTLDSICTINYYHKRLDPLFGQDDPSRAYKVNVNDSDLLKSCVDSKEVNELVERLSKNGHFRVRRDSVTTVAKLKEIYSQLQIDNQLQIPHDRSLASHYGLTTSELELIDKIGCEVMHRRLIPSTDLLSDESYNRDQGSGIIRDIRDRMLAWTGTDDLTIYSCHDTNMIAMMAVLGIKIPPPSFTGYIMFERIKSNQDIVAVYYCPYPFDLSEEVAARVWPSIFKRDKYLDWFSLPEGSFYTNEFIETILVETDRK